MIDINTLIRKNIRDLLPYASAREQFNGKASIYLDANENPFENGVNRYPDPQQKKIKNLIAKRNGVAFNQITIGNGSDELLDMIMRVFCEPSIDNIIITPPTFGIYKVLANTNNVEVREADLTDEFELNVSSITNLVDANTKLIFICSPNNPTGNLMELAAIKSLLKLQCLIVIDEAYIDFSNQESWISSLDKYPNLIVTQTLSKAWAHAGIRLGMSFSSKEIAANLNKIRLPYNINALSQQKAIDVLSNPSTFKRDVQSIKREKALLEVALKSLKIVENLYPSDANFFLAQFTNASSVYSALANKGIILRNFSKAKGCTNCLRISVGTSEENEALIQNLKKLN
ncbi:MAG: histidinol-phosphate transaminase [Cyclobacteriaceae bacterium]|nr:histidinol-phosphate transaminase [Cyclobacteriaceae bacterium]